MRAGTGAMKLRAIGTRLLACASATGLALLLASCGASNTVDYLYVTSNAQSSGQIDVYQVDSESGAIRQIADSPYPSGGENPVDEVATPDGKYLYVANHDSNAVVMFAIGSDGKLYPLQTVTTPGTEPVALAVNSAETELYVLDYYGPAAPGQPSYTDLNPGPGAVAVYPLDKTTGKLGTPIANGAADYWPVECFPTNMALTPNGNDLYVTNTNAVVVTTSPPVTGTIPQLPSGAGCHNYGTISAFAANGSSGLTQIGNDIGMPAGSEPTGITTGPGNSYVYVTDSALDAVDTYAIGADGSLSLTASTPTGNQPMGATVTGSGTGAYLFVTNYSDGTISSYSLSSGVPTQLATTSAGSSGPLCIELDPELGRYLYTSDYVGGKMGGAELDPSSGALALNEGAPYATSGQPTCVAAVAHAGNPNGL